MQRTVVGPPLAAQTPCPSRLIVHSTNTPKITVYVTNHNYGRFIERALESVFAQTVSDWELLIIDDGSTDGSQEIIDRYASRPNVVVVYQQNKGLNVTNNIALRMAHGKYVMRLDADDYLDPHALEILSAALDRNDALGLVFPDYYLVDEDERVLEIVRRHDFGDVTLLDQPAHGACTLVRRSFLLELGGYDESFRCQDGYDLWVRMTALHPVQNINLPLFYYRQHGSSLTRNERRILDTRAAIVEKHVERANKAAAKATAIIPVRGSAMDPRSEALRPLRAKPLIEWTLDAALAAKRIEKVIVTTPDERILEHVSKRYADAVECVHRDRSLARVNVGLEATITHALSAHPEHGKDLVCMLSVESPFRGARTIDAAVDALEAFGTDMLVGVRPENNAFFRHTGDGLASLRSSQALRLEAEELYRRVGDFLVVRRAFFDETKTLLGGRIGHLVLDQRSAMNLSSDWDWQLAELVAAEMGEA